MRFNNDSGANYDSQVSFANGTTTGALEELAQTSARAGAIVAASGRTGNFGNVVVVIPDYAASNNEKVATALTAGRSDITTGTQFTQTTTAAWRNSSAITRVTLIPASGNFVIGSRATIYGLA